MADTQLEVACWGNLLTEALLPVRAGGVERAHTLPGVLHVLATEDVEGFPGLRRHQRQPWYSFLVQIAVIAAEKQGWSGAEALQASEDAWRTALRALTGGRDEAWCLVVADLSQPAFLQAPVPASSREGWSYQRNADAQDLLQVAKRHDLKGDVMHSSAAHHWAWTLVAVQTSDGPKGGRDVAGVVRMNKGNGSRALVGPAPSTAWSARVRRDVDGLLRLGDRIYEPGPATGDTALVWLLPWGAKDSPLSLHVLHPLFLEVCRPLRLARREDSIAVGARTPKRPRIDGKELKGNVGDPWIPIEKKEGKALAIAAGGFPYDKVVELLLTGDWRHGVASGRSHADRGYMLQAMARSQGKTLGLHERWVDMPPAILSRMESARDAEHLRVMSLQRCADVGIMWTGLRRALLVLQQSAPSKPDWKSKSADTWRKVFNDIVDDVFFAKLWEAVDADVESARAAWRQWLLQQARDVLDAAIDATPLASIRRYRAIAAAEARVAGWPKGN